MRIHSKVIAAAAFAVAGIGLISMPPAMAQDANSSGQQSQQKHDAAAGQSTRDQSGVNQSGAGQSAAGQSAAGQSAAGQSTSANPAGSRSGASASMEQQGAQTAIIQVASAALQPNGLKNIANHLSRADRDRLKNLGQGDAAQQLNQSVTQIKQAFKEKYQQDFDLARNGKQALGTEFITMGGEGSSAQQAGARIGASGSAGSSGASGSAGLSGSSRTGSGARTSTTGRRMKASSAASTNSSTTPAIMRRASPAT